MTGWPRADLRAVDVLAQFGVATVHEATGRSGYLGPSIRPAWPGARAGGTAVTALCWPGDNLMIHAAVEQCADGELGLDRYGLRKVLAEQGVEYLDYKAYLSKLGGL